MYQILFHVASITILEICFFFYYVGPLETEIFLNYVKRILNEPVKNLDNFLQQFHISREVFISRAFYGDDRQTIENDLYQDSVMGKKNREKDNNQLFLTVLEYWSIVCLSGVVIFMMQCLYEKYCKTKSKKNMVTIFSDPSLNHIELPRYRKNSIDVEDLDNEIVLDDNTKDVKPDSYKKTRWLCLKTGSHYIIYGGSIITFQYLFFKYVVFEYKPLSIEEIKYYIYKNFLSD